MSDRSYNHAEAFCLMLYRSDDGTEEEVIWNSRDGVTPFVITLRSGKQATHVDWHLDQRVPDFQPHPGERMFVSLTPQRAREHAEANVDRCLADPTLGPQLLQQYGTREAAIDALADSYLAHDGAPDLVEVQP